MHLFLVIFVIGLIYTIYSSNKSVPKEVPPPFLVATPQTANWQECFNGLCESPAEIAFLNAIIPSYQLLPKAGILQGGGLELQLQVAIGHYRVDFLANKRLVVEIDGAAYHSSPEAIEKDRIRDLFLMDKGYEILRIPAKTVFQTPGLAVNQVYKALSQPPPAQVSARNRTAPKHSAIRTNVLSDLGQLLEDAGNWMDRALAIQNAGEAAAEIFHLEVKIIDSALELAELRIKEEEWLSKAGEWAAHLYQESKEQLSGALKKDRNTSESSILFNGIPPILPPATHPNAEINAAITAIHSRLLEDRSKYFSDIRGKLIRDIRLWKHVKAHLKTNHCWNYWFLISPPNDSDFLSAKIDELIRNAPTMAQIEADLKPEFREKFPPESIG